MTPPTQQRKDDGMELAPEGGCRACLIAYVLVAAFIVVVYGSLIAGVRWWA